ncbi:hypothetical protein D4R42_05645 [bacterium]|nr:MAG: hypothetical protein D4R42_05645 [bacterium]
MPEKTVSDPTQDETPKPNRKELAEEPVKEFKAKLNKYGFLHVPKKARSFLPFKIEEPLTVRIDGDHLTIAAATKSQPEEPRPSA